MMIFAEESGSVSGGVGGFRKMQVMVTSLGWCELGQAALWWPVLGWTGLG